MEFPRSRTKLLFHNNYIFLEIALEREMRSYFGGFLCASWSPSGRFLAAGGEDDLITVMSVETGKIVARCQGHSRGSKCYDSGPIIVH